MNAFVIALRSIPTSAIVMAVQIVALIGRHAVYNTNVYRFNDGTTRTVELDRNPHNVEYVHFKLVSYGNIDLY